MERLVQTLTLDKAPRPAELFHLLQEIAAEDALRRGGGQPVLLERGCTWVVVKNRLSFARWPRAGETISLTTWPLRGRLSLYPRGFEIYDASGARLLRAESMWAIMDVESRSMISGESRGIELQGVEEERFAPSRRIRMPEGGEMFDLVPTLEQIDDNGHMNNAAYLDAVAAMLPEALRGREPRAIAVDYEHEILPGRHAQVRAAQAEESAYFEGSMEDKICFRLQMSY